MYFLPLKPSAREKMYLSAWSSPIRMRKPLNENGRHVTVDLVFTDGTTLRDSGATDFEGISMHPNISRGIENTWRQVQCNIGQWVNGKTIDRILVDYDQGTGTGAYTTYLDDIIINY